MFTFAEARIQKAQKISAVRTLTAEFGVTVIKDGYACFLADSPLTGRQSNRYRKLGVICAKGGKVLKYPLPPNF